MSYFSDRARELRGGGMTLGLSNGPKHAARFERRVTLVLLGLLGLVTLGWVTLGWWA